MREDDAPVAFIPGADQQVVVEPTLHQGGSVYSLSVGEFSARRAVGSDTAASIPVGESAAAASVRNLDVYLTRIGVRLLGRDPGGGR